MPSQQEIDAYIANLIANGGTLQDALSAAQQHGVDPSVATQAFQAGSTNNNPAGTPGSTAWADEQYQRADEGYWQDYAANIAHMDWETFQNGGGANFGYVPGVRGYTGPNATPFLDTTYGIYTDPNRGSWKAQAGPGQTFAGRTTNWQQTANTTPTGAGWNTRPATPFNSMNIPNASLGGAWTGGSGSPSGQSPATPTQQPSTPTTPSLPTTPTTPTTPPGGFGSGGGAGQQGSFTGRQPSWAFGGNMGGIMGGQGGGNGAGLMGGRSGSDLGYRDQMRNILRG
jgi:hypothetical protein